MAEGLDEVRQRVLDVIGDAIARGPALVGEGMIQAADGDFFQEWAESSLLGTEAVLDGSGRLCKITEVHARTEGGKLLIDVRGVPVHQQIEVRFSVTDEGEVTFA